MGQSQLLTTKMFLRKRRFMCNSCQVEFVTDSVIAANCQDNYFHVDNNGDYIECPNCESIAICWIPSRISTHYKGGGFYTTDNGRSKKETKEEELGE